MNDYSLMKNSLNKDNEYFVYLLKCNDETYYCGITNHLQKRIDKHNAGKGAKYTRARIPVELLYFESLPCRSTATRREMQIKKLSRKRKYELINSEVNLLSE